MKYILWIITLPLVIIAAAFAVANRGLVEINLWPFEVLTLPFYLVLLVSLFVGFVLGGVVAYFSAGGTRARAREARYRAEMLERENARLKRDTARAKEPKRTDALSLPAR